MYLSELQNKDIVSIKDGKKIGNIIDVSISTNGNINGLVIARAKFSLFRGNNDEEIRWEQIKKIGEDVILIDTNK